MRKCVAILISASFVLGTLFLSGCTIISVGAYNEPPRIQMDGWVTAYAAAKGIRSWDTSIVKLDILSHEEVISAEVWPVASAGVGVVGARAQILPFEIGIGTLFYHPKPKDYWTHKEPKPCPPQPEPEKNESQPTPSESK